MSFTRLDIINTVVTSFFVDTFYSIMWNTVLKHFADFGITMTSDFKLVFYAYYIAQVGLTYM